MAESVVQGGSGDDKFGFIWADRELELVKLFEKT